MISGLCEMKPKSFSYTCQGYNTDEIRAVYQRASSYKMISGACEKKPKSFSYTCRFGDYKAVESALYEHQMVINDKDENGWAPLHGQLTGADNIRT